MGDPQGGARSSLALGCGVPALQADEAWLVEDCGARGEADVIARVKTAGTFWEEACDPVFAGGYARAGGTVTPRGEIGLAVGNRRHGG